MHIVSAIASGCICSKLRSQTRDQTVPAVETTPTTSVMVQPSIPSESDTLSKTYANGTSHPQAHCDTHVDQEVNCPHDLVHGSASSAMTNEDPHPPKDAGGYSDVATEARPVDEDAPPSYETITS